jgi:hypothetical protein
MKYTCRVESFIISLQTERTNDKPQIPLKDMICRRRGSKGVILLVKYSQLDITYEILFPRTSVKL